MKELELLQEKLQHLVRKYQSMQADLERLKKANEKLQSTIAGQQKTMEDMTRDLQARSVVLSSESSGNNREALKQHLDLVIREIEKNIESL